MLITLRPGVNRENLLNALQSVYTDVFNLRAGGGPGRTAHDRLLAYIEWTNSAVRMLDGQISSEDLDRLVLTDRYRLLVSGSAVSLTGTDVQVQRAVNEWVSLELDARVAGFEAVIKELQGRIARWSGDEHCVVPDTSFYIHHPDKLQDIDLGAVTYDRLADFVVLMPMVIVDELDRLKESKDRHVRWRASYTLALLDRLFRKSTGRELLREKPAEPDPDGWPPREIRIELLFDPPGHARLPIADDEIIDRALSVQPLTGQPVTLLTYDTGQAMRARHAGLQVVKLTVETGERPE